MKKTTILYILAIIACLTALFFTFIYPKKEKKEEKKYEYAESAKTEKDENKYMDDEYPFISLINSDDIIAKTEFDEFDLVSFQIYLDEYLLSGPYSNYNNNGYYNIKYIDGSYLTTNSTNKCMKIKIAEIPDTYFDCKYNVKKGYWTFRAMKYQPETFKADYYEPVRIDKKEDADYTVVEDNDDNYAEKEVINNSDTEDKESTNIEAEQPEIDTSEEFNDEVIIVEE